MIRFCGQAEVLLVLLFISLPSLASGAAIENNAIGVRAATMACSFSGLADDAAAVYHNPAGLAFNEKGFWYGEAYLLSGLSKAEYTLGPRTDRSSTYFHIPGLLIAKTYDKWAVGFGFYTSFAGGGVEYDNFQNSASYLEAYLAMSPLASAVSYKVTPNLSVGVNFSIYSGVMGSDSFQEIYPGTFATVKTEYDGLVGCGYSVGFMYKPSDKFRVGAMLRDEIDVEFDGHTDIGRKRYDSEVDFNIPYMFTLGFAYRPAPDLVFNMSWMHVPWTDLDTYDVKTRGVTTKNKTYYKDGLIIGIGFEYILNPEFTLRGGLCYGAGGTRRDGISPTAPDSTKIQPSLGIGWNITEQVEISAALIPSMGAPERCRTKRMDHDSYMFLSGIKFIF